jgi:hypothetical protein
MLLSVTFPSNVAEATLLEQVVMWLLEQAVWKQAIWTSELDLSGVEGLNGAKKLQIENTRREE